MSEDLGPYFLALGSNISFSLATLGFTHFSRRASPFFMNAFKATIATMAFTVAYLFEAPTLPPHFWSLAALLLSGLIGLNIGDWFLMRAFSELGPPRTLILFGFQPFLLGIAGYFLFSQKVELQKLIALIFLIGCLLTFSIENLRKTGHWGFKGLVIGFTAILLDALGLVLTRWAFDTSPWISPMGGNFYRGVGALAGFAAIHLFLRPLRLVSTFQTFDLRNRMILLSTAFAGTFLSLALWLTAVQKGHLATLTGISITGPLIAGIFEAIIHRRRPSLYLGVAFVFFVIGFSILIF